MFRRAFLSGALSRLALSNPPEDRLSRRNLLHYRDGFGKIKPVRTVAEWEKRRAEILTGMQQVMGPLPGRAKRCPLDVKVDEEADAGPYVRRLISYAAEPGGRVPAYLLIPKPLLDGSDRRFPAALCLHPTDNKIGHNVVVGLGGQANRQYAVELAQRGYVVLAPSYPLLANYQPSLKALGYRSGTMKAVWDNIRGIDLLESLPFVRRGAIGAIGHSLGGHNAVYTAAFEPRIRAIVSSCGLDSFVDYQNGDIRGWTSERYMPALAEYRNRLEELPFDFHEVIGALAPRACLISAPAGDANFQARSVDEIAAAAIAVYRLYGKPENLLVRHPNGGHDFPDDMRKLSYELFDAHLRRDAAA